MLEPSELFPEIPNLYEFPSVHADMIYDEHRVHAYERAIAAIVRDGDIVVDVGTGTGLLAFLCLRAGAARVHAIERSPIIDCARELAQANGFSERIEFHAADSRGVTLGEKADVIVSELIGHMAFEEGMVETLLDARGRFLRDGGSMIPERVTLYAAPVCERVVYAACVDGWRPAYGIDYAVMRKRAVMTCYVTEIAPTDLVADAYPILESDLTDGITPGLRVEHRFLARRQAEVNGVALWFDALLAPNVRLSSGPLAKTHWQQCFAPFACPVELGPGEHLDVQIEIKLRSRPDDQFVFRATAQRGAVDAA